MARVWYRSLTRSVLRHACVVCVGTRLVYDRAFLLECRNSPLANSPPVGLPQIPGVTCTTVSPPGQVPPKNGVNPGKHHHHHHGHVTHQQQVHALATGHAAAQQPKKPQQPPAAGMLIIHRACLRRAR